MFLKIAINSNVLHIAVFWHSTVLIVEAVEEPAVGSSTKTTFVPIHETSKRKKRKADKIGETMDKMVTLIEEESSRSKEIIKLMKTESERQEKMDMEFLSMMRSIVDSNNVQQQQQQQQQQQLLQQQQQQRQNMMMGIYPWQGNN